MIKPDTALVPKHQLLDYVSKREFNDFVADMRDFREVTETRLIAYDKRFDSIDRQLLALNRNFDQFKEDVRVQNGAMMDKFDENMKITLEYVQNIEKTKVDEKRFEELKEWVSNYLRK
jgi:hypothetical protein